MHLVFITRGAKRDVDEMVKFLETAAFLVPYIDVDGTKKAMPIQGLLQPVQLWSYVFPEGAKDTVLNSLCSTNQQKWTYNNKVNLGLTALRKALNLEKIPTDFKKDNKLYLPLDAMKNIAISPIGIKKDRIIEDQGTIHEGI